MNNPYKVLGVSEDATQDEIRAAYLELVKRYHPDRYPDEKQKKVANEKLVEINEAYEFLAKRTNQGRTANGRDSYSSGGYGGYSGAGGPYSGPNAADFARVRSYISLNNLEEAKRILDFITIRNAEWYYLYGVIYQRQGWYNKAMEYFSRAYQQEPGNAEYANAYRSMNNAGSTYTRSAGNGGGMGCSGCDVCSTLICADCCCECMGGDLIRCC